MSPSPPDPDGWLPITVKRVIDETPMDRTFHFEADDADAFRFRPGQFVLVRDPEHLQDEEGRPVQRAYSLSTDPHAEDHFGVTVRDMGRFGDRFFNFPVGKRLEARPPQGAFVLAVEPGQRLVLCGGGSGVAPYRSFVLQLAGDGHEDEVVVLSSAREPDQLVFDGWWREQAEALPWLRYVPTVTRWPVEKPWPDRRGRIDAALLEELVEDAARTVLYACGPTAFVEGLLEAAADLDVPPANLRRERWG